MKLVLVNTSLLLLIGFLLTFNIFVLILKHLQGKMKIFILLNFFLYVHIKIVPKPETENNKLFASYGTNFRYLGEIKNGLNRVSRVASISIPRFKDIQVNPIHFRNCMLEFLSDSELPSDDFNKTVYNWCAKVIPYIKYLKKKEKYHMERLHDLLEDLYAALPKLKLHAGTKVKHRSRRGLGAILLSAMPDFINLAVESISSFIKKKQDCRMNEAMVAMREDQAFIRKRLQQYANDFLMYGEFNVEKLDEAIHTVDALHQRQTEMEALFSRNDMTSSSQSIRDQMLDVMSFNFDLQRYLTLTEEEHVNQYSLLEMANKHFLRAITTL